MPIATREAYGLELAELVKKNPKVVVLDADLAGSTKTILAKKAVPERFFDLGIAEADMIGHAAGLAASGYIPFASSFSMFCTGRAWEQIRNSVAYPHLNVKIVGTHSGIAVGEDGVSHQAIEDIALMRAIPGMEVYVPCDGAETRAVIRYVAETENPCYVRLGRSSVEDVYPNDMEFDFSRIHVLNRGKDVAIFACGLEVQETLKAVKRLQAEGINPTVVDVCSIKPLDEKGILEILETHERIITAEEHNIIGGLGDAVSAVSVKYMPRKIKKIGLQDRFAESGPFDELLAKYNLTEEAIYHAVKE
ncbi:MAG: transketolase family protein [Erysipelotrichia bacterium]|nr:transketolase family protein [Erysipelotrichia bacterium]